MLFKFENLEVYKLSINLIREIYKIVQKLPRHEEYVLKPQLLRAAVSITLNIAEGAGRRHKKEFARFIRIAIGSLQEVQAILKILLDLDEIKPLDLEKVMPIIQELYFKLIALEKSLRLTT